MSAELFRNCKHARRRLPEVFLCIQAVDKNIKPSYLWDAFTADASEIQLYLEDLYLRNLIDHKLNVLRIGDTIFVTQYDNLKHHLNSYTSTTIDLVNVSETVETPLLLTTEEKTEVLKPIMDCSLKILNHLGMENGNNCVENVDYMLCNPSTLFGVLLGYPVLYWFSHQSPYSDFTCLSMLPLKVYKIITNFCLPTDCSTIFSNSRYMPTYHELFSFSIPENVCKETDCVVRNWFQTLTFKNSSNSIFHDLKISTDIVSMPSVSM